MFDHTLLSIWPTPCCSQYNEVNDNWNLNIEQTARPISYIIVSAGVEPVTAIPHALLRFNMDRVQ